MDIGQRDKPAADVVGVRACRVFGAPGMTALKRCKFELKALDFALVRGYRFNYKLSRLEDVRDPL
jgi:hypothetical protein